MSVTMKVFLTILAYLLFNLSFSQTLETIKSSDTLYIYFDYGKYQDIFLEENITDVLKSKIYRFSPDSYNNIFLKTGKYLDYDNYDNKREATKMVVDKCFLKEKKNQILDINFFIKNGFRETFFLIYKKKLFLIDKKDIFKNKLILKEMRIENFRYFEE
ncbi:MAG: hypothetical protein LCH35_13375 [Bacteroidetes bacterium]|nr:hypothetical protein [Bacteroidota bacterium]